ncbi:hypothetical protein CPT03_19255 [Pedobacter ginsengisoli]|uniref:Outer membrane protein beta-barrel domain-containing protein n=1 Tax=Pedobacter ginsengisoli TaxID=363852 RepID=A0A2D1UA35_9SPHI|nr:TonB-dependent receptor [Pedobacter ginsengisoli]ATP58446.1 hypothetical protein CPT03_19255 [Pedobacter ginsengisoli]
MKTYILEGLKLSTGILLPYILLIILTSAQLDGYAQTSGNISGKVVDNEGASIEYASVALLYEDGKMIKGALSDSTGKFLFTAIPDGKYLVKISGISYHSLTTEIFVISVENRKLDLGLLKLKEDSKLLNAVVISAQKKLIEQTIDKTVINVENSIVSEGNTALELLARAPGVKVDDEGQISLKGRSGVLVMINGKSTYLSPKELSTLLKGTNSSSISKIEIMSNPSAKYDAAGNGGIINIQMKKNMKTGLNGSISLNGGASRNARYGSATILNYRNEKLNVYGSYDYGYRGETEYLDFVRRFYDNGNIGSTPTRTSYQDTETDEPLHTNNFRLGLDYELDSSNTLGFLINGNVGKYTHDSKTGNRLISGDGSIINQMATTNYDQQNWKNLTYNVNYLHKFNKEGRTFSADADFASNSFTSKLNLKTTMLQSTDGQTGAITSRRGYVPAITDVYLAKVDYTDPLNKTIKLESGLKSSFIQSDNNLRYDILNNGNWEYDTNGSNHFKYKEQIHAGYLNFNQEFKGFSVQAGLRGEYTRTEGHQITTDSLLTRSYFQLFPSVFVSKPLGSNHLIQAAYSRRIERPDYGDLNPFRMFRDPLLFYQGNPFLKPELINTFQLSHSFKGKYTTALNYNRTTDVITWLSGQIDSLNATFESPQNLSKLINYGVSFTASTTFFDWWNGTHFANIFRNEYKGNVQNSTFNNNTTSFSFNSQNSFKAGKGYTLELSGFYYSGSVYGISEYKGSYAISTGAQKAVLKDKGTIKLMINDIFQSDRYREQTKYQNIDMYTNKRPDSRRVMLSFSYRFGNQNISKKDRKTGSEDIQNRVKGGG